MHKTLELELTAEAMIQLGWNAELGKNEQQAVLRSGVDVGTYKGEIICLSLFSVIYAFSIWSSQKSLSQDEIKYVTNSFYALIEKQCNDLPSPQNIHNFILMRIREYHAAQIEDEKATLKNSLSLGLPRVFLASITTTNSEPPAELMVGVSPRFQSTVRATENTLDDLWKRMPSGTSGRMTPSTEPPKKPQPNDDKNSSSNMIWLYLSPFIIFILIVIFSGQFNQ